MGKKYCQQNQNNLKFEYRMIKKNKRIPVHTVAIKISYNFLFLLLQSTILRFLNRTVK